MSGNRLQRDGQEFVAHGFNMVGLLTPTQCGCTQGTGTTAHNHFNTATLQTLTTPPWSANMLRFQVSQRGLADSTYSTAAKRAAYLQEIVDGVATIRAATSATFPIVLSMQDQSIGCGNVDPLPSQMTQDAWDILAPGFSNDPYVLFELFNEPQNTTSEWAQWANGGTGALTDVGGAVIGHQQLVDHIRNTLGVDNVLIADIARLGEHAENIIALSDSGSGRGIVYGVHPYTFAPTGMGVANNFTACESAYETRWAFIRKPVAQGGLNAPALITEWNYTSSDCGSDKQQYAPQFLEYCSGGITSSSQNAVPIGILAHAGDVTNTTIAAWNGNGTISPVTCSNPPSGWGQGDGVDLQAYYAELVAAGY